jgi:hypothetical protein
MLICFSYGACGGGRGGGWLVASELWATGCCGGFGWGLIQIRVNCWCGQDFAELSWVSVNLMGLSWVTCKGSWLDGDEWLEMFGKVWKCWIGRPILTFSETPPIFTFTASHSSATQAGGLVLKGTASHISAQSRGCYRASLSVASHTYRQTE